MKVVVSTIVSVILVCAACVANGGAIRKGVLVLTDVEEVEKADKINSAWNELVDMTISDEFMSFCRYMGDSDRYREKASSKVFGRVVKLNKKPASHRDCKSFYNVCYGLYSVNRSVEKDIKRIYNSKVYFQWFDLMKKFIDTGCDVRSTKYFRYMSGKYISKLKASNDNQKACSWECKSDRNKLTNHRQVNFKIDGSADGCDDVKLMLIVTSDVDSKESFVRVVVYGKSEYRISLREKVLLYVDGWNDSSKYQESREYRASRSGPMNGIDCVGFDNEPENYANAANMKFIQDERRFLKSVLNSRSFNVLVRFEVMNSETRQEVFKFTPSNTLKEISSQFDCSFEI